MVNINFINDPEYLLTVGWFFGIALVCWFMGFGISSVVSIFIKVLKKAV